MDSFYRLPRHLIPARAQSGNTALIRHGYDFDFPQSEDEEQPQLDGKRPRACFLVNSVGMSAFYRAYLPARELARLAGWHTWIGYDQWREQLEETLSGAQVIVLHAPHDARLLEQLDQVAPGALVVVDMDDCLGAVPVANPAHLYWKENWPTLARYLERADVVTCPSVGLQQWLEPYCRRVELVPNFLDLTNPLWQTEGEVDQPRDRWIGFYGSYSHLPDLALIKTPVQRVLEVFKDTRFALMGTMDMYHSLDLPRERRVWIPTRPQERFMSGIRSFHVGLAPLQDTLFNRSKSPLKLIEYLAAGVYPIASDVGPYHAFGDQVTTWAQSEGWEGEQILPLVYDAKAWEVELFSALNAPHRAAERLLLMQRYVYDYCGSENLEALAHLYTYWHQKGKQSCPGPPQVKPVIQSRQGRTIH